MKKTVLRCVCRTVCCWTLLRPRFDSAHAEFPAELLEALGMFWTCRPETPSEESEYGAVLDRQNQFLHDSLLKKCPFQPA